MDNQEHFIFRGRSSREFYLYIERDIAFPSPERDVSFVDVLGRDGSVAIDNRRLESVQWAIPVIVRPPKGMKLRDLTTEITEWLKGESGWHPLRFGSSPEYEYQAMMVETFNVQNTILNHGRTVLTFKVQPRKRRINEKKVEIAQRTALINPYSRPSKPLIEVEGVGDITLMNNNDIWLQLRGIGDRIEVDSNLMTVYRDAIPMYHHMFDLGEFPMLQSGVNEITWTGRIHKLTISPRWESII